MFGKKWIFCNEYIKSKEMHAFKNVTWFVSCLQLKAKAALPLFPLVKKKSIVLSFAKKSRADRHLKIFIISLNL